MKKYFILIIILGLVLTTNLNAAELLFDVNFNADSVGLLPLSGTGPYTPTFIIQGGGSVSVVYTKGNLSDKPVVMKDQSPTLLCRIAFRIQPPKTAGTIKVSWDGLVIGSMQRGAGATISAWNQTNTKSPFIMEYIEGGKLAMAGISNLNASYAQGVANHFDLWINLDEQLIKVYMDNEIIVYSHVFIRDPNYRLDNVYMVNFDTGVANSSNQEYALDNIHIEWDTEMATEKATWQQLKGF